MLTRLQFMVQTTLSAAIDKQKKKTPGLLVSTTTLNIYHKYRVCPALDFLA